MVKKKKRSREVKNETIKSRRVICGKWSRAWPRMDDLRTAPIDTIAMWTFSTAKR